MNCGYVTHYTNKLYALSAYVKRNSGEFVLRWLLFSLFVIIGGAIAKASIDDTSVFCLVAIKNGDKTGLGQMLSGLVLCLLSPCCLLSDRLKPSHCYLAIVACIPACIFFGYKFYECAFFFSIGAALYLILLLIPLTLLFALTAAYVSVKASACASRTACASVKNVAACGMLIISIGFVVLYALLFWLVLLTVSV